MLPNEKTHHVLRDLFSGARLAYPLSKRDAPSHAKNFRHFVGLRANELATKTLIKLDEAGELEQAAHQVGFIPETSLPNTWPHNALLERDVREEKECCRSIHLQGPHMNTILIPTPLPRPLCAAEILAPSATKTFGVSVQPPMGSSLSRIGSMSRSFHCQ